MSLLLGWQSVQYGPLTDGGWYSLIVLLHVQYGTIPNYIFVQLRSLHSSCLEVRMQQ